MSTASPAPEPEKEASIRAYRPDPFALPTETRGRFYLLVVTALLLAWNLPYSWIEVPDLFAVPDPTRERDAASSVPIEIQELARKAIPGGLEALTEEEQRTLIAFYQESWEDMSGVELTWLRITAPLSFVGLLLPLAIFFAWFHRRSDGAETLDKPSAPRLHAEIEHLSQRLGILPRPELVVRPGFLGGRASGGRGGPRIELSGSPRWIEKTWNDLGRAVLLHELGHVVNKDFRIRELVRWLYLVLCLFLFGGLVYLLSTGRLSDGLELLVRNLSILGAAWVMWAGMVRDREFFADQRAASWGYGKPLRQRLSLPAPHDESERRDDTRSRWIRTVRAWLARKHHPTNAERVEALGNMRHFFSLSFGFTFSTSLLLSIPVSSFGYFARDLFTSAAIPAIPLLAALPSRGLLLPALVALFLTFSAVLAIAAIFFVRSLGLQVLREGLADRLERRGSAVALAKLLGLSFTFSLGFEVGLAIWNGPPSSIATVLGFFPVFVLLWVWLVQIYAAGRWALGACSGPTPPRRLIRFISVAGAAQWILLAWSAATTRLLLYFLHAPELPQNLPFATAGSLATILLAVFAFCTLVIAVVFWAITVLLIESRPTPCRQCGHDPSTRPGIENLCLSCGTPRASWLFPPAFDLRLGFRPLAP